MNLFLVDEHEVVAGSCTIGRDDRRFTHLRDVIGLELGKTLRAGIARGPLGTATITAFEDASATLALAVAGAPSAAWPVDLVLAIPRPKVVSRVVEIAASFGVARIDLTNAWRVDKSYLSSPRLAPDALADAARLGAEQGGTTHLPSIEVHPRLMPLLDRPFRGTRLIAHPGAPPLESVALGDHVTLAVGPEGGWIQRELETFERLGFTTVSLGAPILRTEAAISALFGQLLLVQRSRFADAT